MYNAPMALRSPSRGTAFIGHLKRIPTVSPEILGQGEIISARAPPMTKEANQPVNGQNVGCPWAAVIPRFTSTGPAAHGSVKMMGHVGLRNRQTYGKDPRYPIQFQRSRLRLATACQFDLPWVSSIFHRVVASLRPCRRSRKW